MKSTTASPDISGAEATEQVTNKMVVLGRQRSRGRRLMKLVITIIALAISGIIFGNIYLQTLAPGFDWK